MKPLRVGVNEWRGPCNSHMHNTSIHPYAPHLIGTHHSWSTDPCCNVLSKHHDCIMRTMGQGTWRRSPYSADAGLHALRARGPACGVMAACPPDAAGPDSGAQLPPAAAESRSNADRMLRGEAAALPPPPLHMALLPAAAATPPPPGSDAGDSPAC